MKGAKGWRALSFAREPGLNLGYSRSITIIVVTMIIIIGVVRV